MKKKLPTSLLELLEEMCTNPQIHFVLKRAQDEFGRAEVQIGGTKEEMLTNLRGAIEKHYVTEDQIQALVRDAEENGDQHIFYYVPKNSVAGDKGRDGEALAACLFRKPLPSMGFPRYRLIPREYVWADFRVAFDRSGWIAKLYGQKRAWKRRKVNFNAEETVRTEIYEAIDTRLVCVARWVRWGGSPKDILEIRVPQANSFTELEGYLHSVWENLAAGIDRKDFIPWTLSRAMARLFKEDGQHNGLYEIGPTCIVDPQSVVSRFRPHTEEEGFSVESESHAAVEHLIQRGSNCRELVVRWNATDGSLQSGLETVLGGFHPNHVLIRASTTPQGVDYVTHRLREFGA